MIQLLTWETLSTLHYHAVRVYTLNMYIDKIAHNENSHAEVRKNVQNVLSLLL